MSMTLKAASRLHSGEYSEQAIIEVARSLHEELGSNASLGFVFVTREWRADLEETLELIRLHARVPLLVGSCGTGLVGRRVEMENRPGLSVLLLVLPEDSFQVFSIPETAIEETSAPNHWCTYTGLIPDAVRGWAILANPSFQPLEDWLKQFSRDYEGKPVSGGLASAPESDYFLFQDSGIVEDPVIAVAFKPPLFLAAFTSQGCRPIGEPLPITKAEENFIIEIGNVPAYQALESAFMAVPAEERNNLRNNLFVGLAVSEYVDEFQRGDFLIRNILGADPQMGALAIGAYPRIGQTIQFQIRDAKSAHEDLIKTFREKRSFGQSPLATLLFSCAGRGKGLFGVSDHDAVTLADTIGDVPVAGFFANGEIGPVGKCSYLHGYTASGLIFFSE
jgi:small ligand-binding sensory domain FIST